MAARRGLSGGNDPCNDSRLPCTPIGRIARQKPLLVVRNRLSRLNMPYAASLRQIISTASRPPPQSCDVGALRELTMNRSINKFGILATIFGALYGCGGASGTASVDFSSLSGTYSAAYTRGTGTMTISVATNGQITVTIVDSGQGTFCGTGIANHVGGFFITCNGANNKTVSVNGTLGARVLAERRRAQSRGRFQCLTMPHSSTHQTRRYIQITTRGPISRGPEETIGSAMFLPTVNSPASC